MILTSAVIRRPEMFDYTLIRLGAPHHTRSLSLFACGYVGIEKKQKREAIRIVDVAAAEKQSGKLWGNTFVLLLADGTKKSGTDNSQMSSFISAK